MYPSHRLNSLRLLVFAEVFDDPLRHQSDLTCGKLATERDHAVTALCDVIVDLAFCLVLVWRMSEIRYDQTRIQCLPLGLRAVADRAVLAEKRGLVVL